MSRLDTGGGAISAMSRNGTRGIPRIGQTETLDAPGVVPMPVDTTAEQTIQDFASIFGLAGQLAEQTRQERDRTKARNEREQQAIDQSLIGNGAQAGAIDLPGIAGAIERGEVAPLEGEDSATFAKRIVAMRTQGQPDKYGEGYARVTDNIAAAAENMKTRAVIAGRKMALESNESAAISARTPEELNAAYEGARAIPGMSGPEGELQARASTYLSALRSWAARGKRDEFNMVLGVMGEGLFKGEIEQAKMQLSMREGQQQSAVNNDFRNTVGQMAMNYYDGKATAESIRQYIDGAPGADAETRRTQREHIDAVERARTSAQMAAYKQQRENDIKTNWINGSLGAANAGLLSQVPPQGLSIEYPDGSTVTMSRDETIRRTFDTFRYSTIERHPNDPQAQQEEMIRFSIRNGIPDPSWSNTVSAGFAAASEASTSERPFAIPPVTAEAFGLYKRLAATAPNLLDQFVSGKERDFFDLALGLQTDQTIGGTVDQAALYQASRVVMLGMGKSLGREAKDALATDSRAIAKPWFDSNMVNAHQISSMMSDRSEVLVRGGMDPKTAVDRVYKQMDRSGMNLNGRWTPLLDMNREGLSLSLSQIAKDFDQSNPVAKAGKLTLSPSPVSGLWTLVDRDTNLPASNDASKVIFSTAQLRDMQAKAEKSMDAAERQRAINANATRDQKFPYGPSFIFGGGQ